MNGEELDELDSGYLWKYLDVYYDEANVEWVARISYRYFIHPQTPGTYEIYWRALWTPTNAVYEFTGYVTWYEG
jgi:hypothetical protein